MRPWIVLTLAAPLVILASSALGLAFWLRHFTEVWTASAPGSVIFAAGTLLATYGAIAVGVAKHPGYALALSVVLNWIVYAIAWSFTGPAMFSPETHEIPAQSEYTMPGLWLYVAQQGLLGLLACGAMAWWGSTRLARAKGS